MKEYKDYENILWVSDDGEVINKRTGKRIYPDDRRQIRCQVDYVYYCEKLSRIVAKTFIPNPYNLPYVLHNDGDESNNRVSNLHWSSTLQGRKKTKISQIDSEGKIVKIYTSITSCINEVGFSPNTLYKILDKEAYFNGFKYKRST